MWYSGFDKPQPLKALPEPVEGSILELCSGGFDRLNHRKGVKSMKKTICLLYVAFFTFTSLYATPTLLGSWLATVEYNRSFDTYKINFSSDGRCIVRISNDNTEQETAGYWSWDGSLFRLNATFNNVKISYLQSIQWTSVLNFSPDNSSFNILGRAATNGSQVRITFYRNNNDIVEEKFNERVIPQIFNALRQNIPLRSSLAVVGIISPNPNESAFYTNELTFYFVETRNYTVVDRSHIETVFNEQQFQLHYADDKEIVSIGSFIGASVVITGSISGTGSQRRMVIKAIDVLTSEILSMVSVSL